MMRPSPLDTVIDLAEQRRDAARQDLARAQHDEQQALMQMHQLTSYTDESQRRWSERAARGVPVNLLFTQQTFMAKLTHATGFQQGVLARLGQQVERYRLQLIEAERTLVSLQQLRQRRADAWQQRQTRQEQKFNDELAATQHRQHAASHPWRQDP